MIHYPALLSPHEDHYAVGVSLHPSLLNSSCVLVQLEEDGRQARVPLTVREARHLAQLLIDAANVVAVHVKVILPNKI